MIPSRAAKLGPNKARPKRTNGPRWGSLCVRRPTCKNALVFSNNTTNTMCTISIDYNFATKPSPLLSFTTERSTPWPHMPTWWPMTLATPAGQPGPSPPYLSDRCSPRCRRESMGGEEMSGARPGASSMVTANL